MKILFLAPLNSIHSQRWIQFFADRGHEIHAIAFPGEVSAEPKNVKLHFARDCQLDMSYSVLKNFTFGLALYKDFRRIAKNVQPDLVHAHQVNINAFILSKVIRDLPFVVTAWGSDVLVRPNKSIIHRYIVKKVLKAADCVSSDADHMKKAMMDLGLAEDKHHLIYFGTDCHKFNPDKRDPNLKTELGFPPEAKLIISLRALLPIYDIKTIIKSVPAVLKVCDDAFFVIVGNGSEKEDLVNLTKELGIADHIIFAGRLSDSDLIRYTASADIYVSSSLSDAGLAASTAEAMACSVPVVITDFGNNSEWVTEGKSGFLFPLEDAETLAEKLIWLLKDRNKAAEIGENGRKVIFERNNVEKEMLKIEQLYEKSYQSRSQNISIR